MNTIEKSLFVALILKVGLYYGGMYDLSYLDYLILLLFSAFHVVRSVESDDVYLNFREEDKKESVSLETDENRESEVDSERNTLENTPIEGSIILKEDPITLKEDPIKPKEPIMMANTEEETENSVKNTSESLADSPIQDASTPNSTFTDSFSDKSKQSSPEYENPRISFLRKRTRYKMKITDLKNTITSLKAANQSLVHDNNLLKEDLQITRENHLKQINSTNNVYDKLHQLQSQITMNDDKQEFQNTLIIKDNEINSQKVSIDSLTKSKDLLQKKLEHSESDYLQLYSNLTELQSKYDAAKEEILKLEFKCNKLESDNKRIRKERTETSDTVAALESEILQLSNEREALVAASFSSSSSEISDLNLELQSLHNSNTSLSSQITNLNNSLSVLESDNSRLLSMNKSQAFKIDELERRLEHQLKLVKEYQHKLSESQLSAKIKANRLQDVSQERENNKEFFTQLEPFLESFSYKFHSLIDVISHIVPKYLEQKAFLTKLSYTLTAEEKGFMSLNELKGKNLKFRKILKSLIEENQNLRNNLCLCHDEIESLKAVGDLKDELINVLEYNNESCIPSTLSSPVTLKNTNQSSHYEEPKSVLINGVSVFDYSKKKMGSPESDVSTSTDVMSYTTRSSASSSSPVTNSINVNLNEILFLDKDDKFNNQLGTFLKTSGEDIHFSDTDSAANSPKSAFFDDSDDKKLRELFAQVFGDSVDSSRNSADSFGNSAESFGNSAESFGNSADTFGNLLEPPFPDIGADLIGRFEKQLDPLKTYCYSQTRDKVVNPRKLRLDASPQKVAVFKDSPSIPPSPFTSPLINSPTKARFSRPLNIDQENVFYSTGMKSSGTSKPKSTLQPHLSLKKTSNGNIR